MKGDKEFPAEDRTAADALLDRLLDVDESERERVLADDSLDPRLRSRVRRLLDLIDSHDTNLDRPLVTAESVGVAAAPRRIGSFEVLGVLGSGAMGTVYRARQAQPERDVAVKLLHATEEPRRLARFEREAEFLARLQHPGVAQVFEAGQVQLELGSAAYIAMELVDGHTLGKYVVERDPNLAERVDLVIQIAEAVHHAHLRGVIHRDLKPGNVLVSRDGRVKVIDFGVARELADGPERGTLERTLPGQVVGTLAYMSPEQVQASSDGVDARTDVYSLGAIAFELFSGTLPHDLDDTTLAQAARRIVERDARRLGAVAPACRGDLDAILGRALEKDRERRFQSASALAEDLRRHLAGEAVQSRPASALYQLQRLAARNRAAVLGAAATLLSIVIGAGVAVSYALENRDLARSESSARAEAEREAERAEDEAERANLNAAESARLADVAELRLADRELVTNWQKTRLEDLDVYDFGEAIRSTLEASVGSEGTSDDDVEWRLSALREVLEGVNLTNVARDVLRDELLGETETKLEQSFADRPELQAELLMAHASVLENIGAAQDSVSAARRATRLLEESYGSHTAPVARAAYDLALLLYRARDFAAAYAELDRYWEGLLALAERGGGQGILAVGWKAACAGSMGRFAESIELFRRQIELIEEHGFDSPEETRGALIDAQLNLAGTLVATGEHLDEAAELMAGAVETLRAQQARPDKLMSALIRQGRLELAQRELDAAERSLEEALGIARVVHGDGHIALGVFLDGLASVRASQGRFEEALALRQEEHDLHLASLGASHEQTRRVELGLSAALLDVGSLEEAHALCRGVYDWALERFGAPDGRTQASRGMLLRILAAREVAEGEGTHAEEISRLEAAGG